jgi:hypothetical protein
MWEARDKKQEARGGKRSFAVWILVDIGYLLILIDIVTLWFNDRISELLCRLLFPAFVFFCPYCGSEYYGSVEVFFKLSSKG